VTFTTSHCRTRTAELPLRANYNLRGHRSEVSIAFLLVSFLVARDEGPAGLISSFSLSLSSSVNVDSAAPTCRRSLTTHISRFRTRPARNDSEARSERISPRGSARRTMINVLDDIEHIIAISRFSGRLPASLFRSITEESTSEDHRCSLSARWQSRELNRQIAIVSLEKRARGTLSPVCSSGSARALDAN